LVLIRKDQSGVTALLFDSKPLGYAFILILLLCYSRVGCRKGDELRAKKTTVSWALTMLVSIGLLISSSVKAEQYPIEEAIDDAGRQRMLTQRILKSYVQVGLGMQPLQSEEELQEAVALFESQYQRLHQWQHEPRVAEQLERLGRLWQVYKQRTLGSVNTAEAQKLLGISESLLSESHRLVLILQDIAATPDVELINVSGRQRMLSQRMAKYYLLSSWGIDTPAISDKMDEVRAEFAAGLVLLESNTYANAEIYDRLARIKSDWAWFNSAIQQQGSERYDLVVMDASEQLLWQTELLTDLYVEESKKAPRS